MLEAYNRYTTDLQDVFDEKRKLQLQIIVEAAIAGAQAEVGMIPPEAAAEIRNAATPGNISLQRVREIEHEIDHDLMAVVKAIAEKCENFGGYVHFGATSYDIQDTVLGLQLKEAKTQLLQRIETVNKELASLAQEHKDSVCIGRTHGQHAIPTTHGFKFANFAYEFKAAHEQLAATKTFGKISGAVGNYSSFGTMKIEKIVLAELGLDIPVITTQVVSRVFLLQYFQALSTIASVADRLAKEIRNLQRTEIGEWFEPSSKSQVGSSTMPQKRNPHKSERVSGLARVIKASLQVALDNVSLEHERDLSNSAPERLQVGQISILTDYILSQLVLILKGLHINVENSLKNLNLLQGRQLAERIMIYLTPAIGRQNAHEILRQLTKCEDFAEALRQSDVVKEHLTETQIDEILDPTTYTGLAQEKTILTLMQLGLAKPSSYAEAGVSITGEHESVAALAKVIGEASNVAGERGIGHYANFVTDNDRTLAMTTDGVGSKVLIAQALNKFDTVGIDCVAMNVNDLLAMNIPPIGFVDYLAIAEPNAPNAAEIAKGLVEGCNQCNIPLLGGETAVMPDVINGTTWPFDLAGTAMGIQLKDKIIDGSEVQHGDVIIGLPSSGVHSNGLSLARKVLLPIDTQASWTKENQEDARQLLIPTKIYYDAVMRLKNNTSITGLAHITGGSFSKLRRLTTHHITLDVTWDIPPIFSKIQTEGKVHTKEMFRTFNMGIGFVIFVRSDSEKETLANLKPYGALRIGQVDAGQAGVHIKSETNEFTL